MTKAYMLYADTEGAAVVELPSQNMMFYGEVPKAMKIQNAFASPFGFR
jgi:hypothetical protein